MNDKIEKALAGIAVSAGVITMAAHYWYFKNLLLDRINNGNDIGAPLGYFDLNFNMYIPLILAFIYIAGGALLFFNIKAGWFVLIIVSLYNMLYVAYSVLFSEIEKDWLEYTIMVLILLANSMFFLLLNKQTMQKYSLSYKVVPVLLLVAVGLVLMKSFL